MTIYSIVDSKFSTGKMCSDQYIKAEGHPSCDDDINPLYTCESLPRILPSLFLSPHIPL